VVHKHGVVEGQNWLGILLVSVPNGPNGRTLDQHFWVKSPETIDADRPNSIEKSHDVIEVAGVP
jgi:hypothetical protein